MARMYLKNRVREMAEFFYTHFLHTTITIYIRFPENVDF